MFVLIKSETGTLNQLEVTSYLTMWAAQQAMATDFLKEYEEYYDTTEPPRDEDNCVVYIYDGDRAVLSLDEPDTPEWAIVEVKE